MLALQDYWPKNNRKTNKDCMIRWGQMDYSLTKRQINVKKNETNR